MVIWRSALDTMIEHARATFPDEACGLVALRREHLVEAFPGRNEDGSPVSYRLDTRDQLRITLEIEDRGDEVGAVYHSHTRTRPYPSATDIRNASDPTPLYIIVSLAHPRRPEARGYWIRDGRVEEEPLTVLPDPPA